MSLVFNERTKLTASWLNTLATALIAAGGFAPAAAFLYGLQSSSVDGRFLVGLILGCAVSGGCLHWLGRVLLGRLRE
jgi:hypothetical protein